MPPGTTLLTYAALETWLESRGLPQDAACVATFIVNLDGVMAVADRHSEHVACAGFQPVLAAGEVTFVAPKRGTAFVEAVSNQSTGYCPDPDCWPAVSTALQKMALTPPPTFTDAYTFRRCPSCDQRNLVKDDWWVCGVCDADLPRSWNF